MTNRRKRRVLHSYLTKLRPRLGRIFGKREYYTPEQVEQAAVDAKLPTEHLALALVIYCTSEDFAGYQAGHNWRQTYWQVREEIGELLFHGNRNFTRVDIAEYVKSKPPRELGEGLPEAVNYDAYP